MNLTAAQLWKFLQSLSAVLVVLTQNRQRNEHLVGVQTWILAPQVFGLRLLYRLNHVLRNEFNLVVDACEILRAV